MNILVNIGGDPNDVNYRYKRNSIEMDRVNRNGGMRRIQNLGVILKQLTTSSLNLDEFEIEFYARVKRRGTRVLDGGWFKGDVSVKDLERILNDMISEIILCPRCKLPEWDNQYCKSCGHMRPKKTRKKNRKEVKEPEEEEEVVAIEGCSPLQTAVEIAKQLYDMRANGTSSELIDKGLDLFWTIDPQDDATHLKWCDAMRNAFFH